jgi:hypothetical protein
MADEAADHADGAGPERGPPEERLPGETGVTVGTTGASDHGVSSIVVVRCVELEPPSASPQQALSRA